MAWSFPTYADKLALSSTFDSGYRIATFELVRAVNQRQAGAGLSITQFYGANGSLYSSLTYADLSGLRNLGLSSLTNLAQANILGVRTAIISMLPYFTQGEGRNSVWTVAAISTAIGYDLSVTPSYMPPNFAAFWQALQDALDLLVYAWRQPGLSDEGNTYTGRVGIHNVDSGIAWSNANNGIDVDTGPAVNIFAPQGAIDAPSQTGFGLSWQLSYNPVANNYYARIVRDIEITLENDHVGSLSEVWLDHGPENPALFAFLAYYYELIGVIYNGPEFEVDFTCPTEIFSSSATVEYTTGTPSVYQTTGFTRQLVNTDFPLGESAVISASIATPIHIPKPFPDYPVNHFYAGFWFHVTQYIDLTGVLTDQD